MTDHEIRRPLLNSKSRYPPLQVKKSKYYGLLAPILRYALSFPRLIASYLDFQTLTGVDR